MSGRILVAGFATRHVAQSAHRAGYKVYAVDKFCDQDLAWYTEDCVTYEDCTEIPEKIAEMASRHRMDAMVVTSRAEAIDAVIPLCGTPPRKAERLLDKLEIQRFFEELDVSIPPLTDDGHFPAMVKPRLGSGGWRNTIVADEEELHRWEEIWPDVPYITQQVVGGVPSSVSCIADGKRARAIAVNRQIILGEDEGVCRFAGSITPFTHPLANEMMACAERICAASGCVGSVGVDFMAGERPWAIEINPRFQATLDTVEMATGESIFSMHMDACRGMLPAKGPVPRKVAIRRILFAERDMQISVDLASFAPRIADIPWPGTEFEEGNALVSVYGCGKSISAACTDLERNIRSVKKAIGF